MPYPLYNVVHIVGIVLVMVALGGAAFASMAVHPNGSVARPIRRWTGIFHGIGLFLVLLGGFGMLARIGFEHGSSWPGWLLVKFGVWTALAAAAILPFRFPGTVRPLLILLPLLGGLAAYMAIYKPL